MDINNFKELYKFVNNYIIENKLELESSYLNDDIFLNKLFSYLINEINKDSYFVNNKIKSILNIQNKLLSDDIFYGLDNYYNFSSAVDRRKSIILQHKYSRNDDCHYFKYINKKYFTNDFINWYSCDNMNLQFKNENNINLRDIFLRNSSYGNRDSFNINNYLINTDNYISNLKKLFINAAINRNKETKYYHNLYMDILYDTLKYIEQIYDYNNEHPNNEKTIQMFNYFFNNHLLRDLLVNVIELRVPNISNRILLVRYNYTNGFELNSTHCKDILLIMN